MANLTASEIAGLAVKAGFSPSRTHRGTGEVAVAVAVALAESGGNPLAHNDTPPDDSYGLWQINMIGDLGPARRRQFGIADDRRLFDPAVNARAAFQVFQDAGNSFTPWSVYKSGSYLRHLKAGVRGAESPSENAARSESDGGLLGPIPGILSTLSSEDTWRRVGMFIGGGILILMALLMVVGPPAIDIASKVMPVGRLARGAKKAVRKVS